MSNYSYRPNDISSTSDDWLKDGTIFTTADLNTTSGIYE